MPNVCKKCGLTTHKAGATACLLCNEPFEDLNINDSATRTDQPSLAPAPSTEKPSSVNAPDSRHWYIKAINRRAKGGIFVGALMMILGYSGRSITKGAAVVSGGQLIALGFFVLLIASVIVFATRRPRG